MADNVIPIGTGPGQAVTRPPQVLLFPLGSVIPNYIIGVGVQCFALWLSNDGGFVVRFAIGEGNFFTMPLGGCIDFGCAPINDGIRMDLAGAGTGAVEVVYWPIYSDSTKIGAA